MHVTKIGQRFNRCPRAWLRDEGGEVLDWMADRAFLVTHGILPDAGGRLDQHPKFLAAIDVIAYEEEVTARALARVEEAKRHGR